MTKEELRQITPEEMAARGLLTPSKNGGYDCACGNGTGHDGTGVKWTLLDGGWTGHCFKCNETWDIFKVIGVKYGLTDFKDQLNKANEIFDPGARIVGDKNFKDYILACHRNLKKFVGENYRGISFDTYKKFLCGYDFTTQRFIIPSSFKHYLERYTGDKAVQSPKKHTGSKDILAFKYALDFDTIFVVEGEFDALSFWDINKAAISFSGSVMSQAQKLLFKKFPMDKKFIVAFDDDDTGRLKSRKVAQFIHDFGYNVATTFLPGYKDANEFICANREKFIETVDNILTTTVFDAPPEKEFNGLIMPEHFLMNENGIIYCDTDNDKFSDIPAYVTRIFHSEDYTDYKVELAIFNRQTDKYHNYIIPRPIIADHKKLLATLSNFNVNINADNSQLWCQFLGDMIAINIKDIEDVITYKKPGWHGDVFIYPSDIVDNGTDYNKMFCTKGDKDIWLEVLKKSFTSVPVAVTLATVLAAPLIRVCGERHIQLALISPSMRGKSAVIKLAMSVYGNPTELKQTFNSTPNAINDLGWRFNDLPCWIDEFQAAGKNIKEQIDVLIYNFENGVSRLRLDKTSAQRDTYDFVGARIFSAEQSLLKHSTGQGAYTRLIELTYNEVCKPDLAFEIHKVVPHNYGFFGRDWIKYIEDNSELLCATYQDNLDKTRKKYPKHPHAYIQAFSLMMTALEHFHNEFLKFYPDEDIREFMNDYVADVIFKVLPNADEATNAKRALKDLAEILTSRSKQFMSFNKASDHEKGVARYFDSTIQPTLGVFLKSGHVGFFPSEIKKYLEKECGYPDAVAIFRALDEMGAIERGNLKNAQFQKNVELNKWTRLYIVRKDFLEEYE